MVTRFFLTLVVLLCSAGPALAAGSTPAAWTTPANVTDTTVAANRVQELRVGIDEAGSATYAWRESDGTSFKVRSRTCAVATCNAIENLTDGTVSTTALRTAIDTDGASTAIWLAGGALQGRVRTSSTWSAAATLPVVATPALHGLTTFSAGASAIGIASGTTPHVITCTTNLASCTDATLALGAGRTLTGAVVVAGDGAAFGAVAWVERDGSGRQIVRYASLRSTAGTVTVGTPLDLSGLTETTKSSLVADVDRFGMTTIAWQESGTNNPLVVQRFTIDTPPTGPTTPATSGASPIIANSLGVGSDGSGNAVVTWVVAQDGKQMLSALPYAALIKGTQQAVTGDGVAQLPTLAVAGNGQSNLAYLRAGQIASSSTATPNGTWTAVTPAPLNGATVSATPALDAARNGATVLAWVAISTTTGEQTIRSARFVPAKVVVKPTITVTRRTAIKWTLNTRVTTNLSGTFEQIGRIKVGGRKLIACRATPRAISGNVTTSVTCKLTRTAIRSRRAKAIRITLVTSFVNSTGNKASHTATFTLPRKR